MANYKCEEISSCENFQSAICLHCNRRLCLSHITEHTKIVFSSVKKLSNEVELTLQQIDGESEKLRNIYNNTLTSLEQWRTQQIENIQQIYEKQLQLIESQREASNNVREKLYDQLERDAQQPLEHLQRQQNANIEILNHIKQTIKQVREDTAHLTWNLSTPSPINIEYPSLDLVPKSVEVQTSTMDKKNSISKQPTIKEVALSTVSSTKIINSRKGYPFHRLVQRFANISSIEQSKHDIAIYIKSSGRNLTVPSVICSYLTAWHRKSNFDEKNFLLYEHIRTIYEYLMNHSGDFGIVVGIQVFFYYEIIHEHKRDMMTFLLQFFLDHQCINHNQILHWYNNKDKYHRYPGFQYAKQLATPFINSFSVANNVNSVQTVSTNSVIPVDQNYNVEIKREPHAMN